MNVTHARDSCHSSVGNPPRITAGVTLKAVDALEDPNVQHFTRGQLAYVIALAYETGRLHAASENIAEAVAYWQEFADPEVTREERVQRRHAEMASGMVRVANRPAAAGLHPLGDWPEVKIPGTADAAYFERIAEPAHCECERLDDGSHRVPDRFPTRYSQERELRVAA